MVTTQTTEAQIVDPTTSEGFHQIACAYGIEHAFEAKITALRARVAQLSGFRWHYVPCARELFNTKFDYAWHLAAGDRAQCCEYLAAINHGHNDPVTL